MTMPRAPDLPDQDQADDDTLVAEARTNPAAFGDLYERYHAIIHNFVRRRVTDSHQAEDLTSQVFLRALRGLPTYQSGFFRGWLYQIARNVILDSYRGQRPTTSGDALACHADTGPGPLDVIEVQEAREEVHRLIDQLPKSQRDVIGLRLRGYTGQEIADTLGLSLSAVKSAQFRAFDTIRRLMAETTPTLIEPDDDRPGERSR